MPTVWNYAFSCPNYQKRAQNNIFYLPMKAAIAKLVSKKGMITTTLVIASFVIVTLPSCKHKQGGCDAYQGSTRSMKAHSHHR